MNGLMDRDQREAHRCCHCQCKTKNARPRHLHQSTLNLGDTAPCYTTTHNQSYSGRQADGRPLILHLRDPSFPSQHQTQLDLGNTTALHCPLRSHTQEVHGPKHVAPRTNAKVENWARYRSGQTIREIIQPQGPSEYWTTYKSEHTPPETHGSPQPPGGRPTEWHKHNILTGEQMQAAGPGKPCRRSRDRLLWAARRRDKTHKYTAE